MAAVCAAVFAHAACAAGDGSFGLLERACKVELPEGPACEAIGAQETRGTAGETIGFRIGPSGEDQVVFHLAAIDSAQDPTGGELDFQVLVAHPPGTETGILYTVFDDDCQPGPDCNVVVTAAPVGEDFTWTHVITDVPRPAAFSYDATILFIGRDVDIADMRTTTPEGPSCAIAGPVGASPR